MTVNSNNNNNNNEMSFLFFFYLYQLLPSTFSSVPPLSIILERTSSKRLCIVAVKKKKKKVGGGGERELFAGKVEIESGGSLRRGFLEQKEKGLFYMYNAYSIYGQSDDACFFLYFFRYILGIA